MRLALTAGGTGGHILPAMAVLEALRARDGLLSDVRFFGPEDRGERASVESRGIHFETVPAAGVRGRGPVRLVRSLASLAWGTLVALKKLRSFRPDAVFSTGGYASFPCSVAARLLRLPLIVYLPDVTPGWAVRAETRLATRMATTTEAALAHLPAEKTTVTGYPVRSEFFATTRDDARRQVGIEAEEQVVVVAGASQGAHAINEAVFAAVPRICEMATVVHVTGSADLPAAKRVKDSLGEGPSKRYHVDAFRADLPVLMVAADLGVFRAGASVLGEVPAAGLPSIFVPGTFAGGHQRENALWLSQGGAAEILEQRDLESLADRVVALLRDRERLAEMREAARELARPDAADAIGDLIVGVARK
jgi:UDP-N-acetylglucosamine--N-acetylmuramyl-(pentapeptide) pyrophosphoryl-undecaprenol N-acetylglucosamine transferase